VAREQRQAHPGDHALFDGLDPAKLGRAGQPWDAGEQGLALFARARAAFAQQPAGAGELARRDRLGQSGQWMRWRGDDHEFVVGPAFGVEVGGHGARFDEPEVDGAGAQGPGDVG